MENKKTVYVWIILILSAIGIVFGLFSFIQNLINIKTLIMPVFLSSPAMNIASFVLQTSGTVLLFIFFIKLYNLSQNLVKWTNIIFGYSIFLIFFGIYIFMSSLKIPMILFLKSLKFMNPIIIILFIAVILIIGIIWFTFVRHLKNNSEKLFSHPQTEEVAIASNEKSLLNKKAIIIAIIIIVTLIILFVYFIFKSKIKKETINNAPVETSTLINTKDVVSDNGQIIEKIIKGTFKIISSNETFDYTEKYNPTIWNVNTRNYNWNTLNECASLGCSFVYFGDYDKNLLMFTSLDINQEKKQGKLALFNDRDNPLIGKITKVVFYVNGDKISGIPRSEDRHVDVFYTISYKENGVSKTTNRIEQNLCNYENIDAICAPIIKKIGSDVFFFDGSEDIYLRSIFLFDKVIKTKLISYSIVN
jgi:hypothetical protein